MEKDECQIMTWATYKKKFNPQLTQVWDSTKGWVRTTVSPTMLRAGFHPDSCDIDGESRKPKKVLIEDFHALIEKSKMIVYFVYHPTASYSGYFTEMQIYWLPK